MGLIVFLCFFFCLLATALGRTLGSRVALNLVIILLICANFCTCFMLYEIIILGGIIEQSLCSWINYFSLEVFFTLFYDPTNTMMLFLVVFITTLVHVYSIVYMHNDPGLIRFFFFLSLFSLFMGFMVISNNLLQFFFSWEGVGVTSYLLINFWFTRIEANRSALKAIIINRLGDFGLYSSLLIIFTIFKTLDFSLLNSLVSDLISTDFYISFFGFKVELILLVGIGLIMAAVGKSAQLGLHVWLADAMEGPTPVSALLHAATMVTAGVFLLIKLSFLLQLLPLILHCLAFWGAMTAFFSSLVGSWQNDLKKIIAFSTCSQLGYMVCACGLGNFTGAFFHLTNHAFFKAMLFMGAGIIIHAVLNEQDLRRLGGLLNFFPLTFLAVLVGSLSLVGFPFLSGFYSKEGIILYAYLGFTSLTHTCYWLLLFAAFFTAYYSSRIIFLAFFTYPRFSFTFLKKLSEKEYPAVLPIFFLLLLTLSSGFLLFELFNGVSLRFITYPPSLSNWSGLVEQESLGNLIKLKPILLVFAGVLSYLLVSLMLTKKYNSFMRIRRDLKCAFYFGAFLKNSWYLETFYFKFTKGFLQAGWDVCFKSIDRGLLEQFFIKNTSFYLLEAGTYFQQLVVSVINLQVLGLSVVFSIYVGLIILCYFFPVSFVLVFSLYFILINKNSSSYLWE